VAQIFPPYTNTVARMTLLGFAAFLVLLTWAWAALTRSPFLTAQQVVREQPVQFSHKHHVSEDGIDCRYCHTGVETSPFAGLPPTETCMNCHRQIWAESPMLEPVRQSQRSGKPIRWTRVHDLPDFVYFDHSIHVRKGVGCSTCHGRIDLMPLTWQAAPLQMQWCLDCHRAPEHHLRPRDQIFNMAWQPLRDQLEIGRRLRRAYGIPSQELLVSCSTCHR
jgi:hypothetical protein